ncbi:MULTISPECIES: ABC transporter permease [Frigoribacterium]|jgi:oligopeptide transport system permease protein|uniref:ABC transporter permease n=1 Tax=Frigoribacterium TaxID=96492 RepID=UPI0005BD447E|nr:MULTISPECIES: ABC transporter permease [Frigoribacterium]KIU02816.1 ABC transporter permease [Frigoribacterium sp. MEB024]KPG74824.1 ABC transporter permease [Frigoribacterium sp. RIT-PI-h]KQM24249.1 ABC transporter permease [Frigoribacterium sp. Leaf8]KQN41796.1 ABC transporter permease [Frigoribacterium sp. Leaf44]KQO47533.1 ABC transporter permease [Frigoribacterium sp. Leaf254]
MLWYTGRRLLQLIPVFFGATFLIYFMVFALPGDPVAALFGDKTPSPAVIEAIRAEYNLDQPFIVQYLLYIGGLFTGDLGTTFSGRPVVDELIRAFPITFRLAMLALLFEAVAGIVVGLIAGLRKGKLFDTSALVVSLLLISVPTFVIGFLLQYVFGIQLGLFRTTVSSQAPWDELVLPAIVLASVSFAYIVRLTRASVSENSSADFVRTASAKGLTRGRVVTVHILRNSLVPVVTYLGVDIGSLMVGAIVTEGIFNIQGVGGTVYRAITLGEGPTVVSFVAVMVIIFMIANLLVDLLYALLDPRIRYAK